MSELPFDGLEESLWERARAAPSRLLALDYDGTLAPFTVDPAAARPHPGARRALERIARDGRTSVAILSGRPPAEIVRLLGNLAVPIVGEHGWTTRFPDGGILRRPIDPELDRLLDRAQADLEHAVAPARIERKRSSVVVHTRGLPQVLARSAERRARSIVAQRHGDERLELRPIDGGLELRLAGHDKGGALVELLEPLGPGAFPVAVGDDDTDEDAFRAALAHGGTGIRVGAGRPSAAPSRLSSPDEVALFLRAWSEQVDGSGPHAPENPDG